MEHYREYLPDLMTSTLFQDMTQEEILLLLEAMGPRVERRRKGDLGIGPAEPGEFRVVLRSTPRRPLKPRQFKYDMPAFGEPGMIMLEIPALSRMGEGLPEGAKAPGHPPHTLEADLELLVFTDEMITAYYSPEVSRVQGIFTRNLYGILAQKVCDVRRELFLLRDGRDMFQRREETLQVFTAGVALSLVRECVQHWNLKHPERQAELHTGGSVDLIRRVLAGERCDVLVVADDTNIAGMLMPDRARGYVIFAGNSMVVAAAPGYTISSGDWREKLLAPGTVFLHKDPYGDPGGYRAVMAMQLADGVEPGLADRLLGHPGRVGLAKGVDPRQAGEHQYEFLYRSMAAERGMVFADLPACMNLSDPACAEVYAKASFAVDPEHTVTGAPIAHALTIPESAKFPEEAKAFARQFLAMDFPAHGFLPRRETVGQDILS